MNCQKYIALSPKEKIEMIGKLIHAVQSDNDFFNRAQALIRLADNKGLFEGVTINPQSEPPTE